DPRPHRMTITGERRRPAQLPGGSSQPPTGGPHRARAAVRSAGSMWRTLPLPAFGGSAAAGVLLAFHIARGGPLLAVRWRLLAELTIWAAAWVAAVLAAFRLPRRAAVPLILFVAVMLRLA